MPFLDLRVAVRVVGVVVVGVVVVVAAGCLSQAELAPGSCLPDSDCFVLEAELLVTGARVLNLPLMREPEVLIRWRSADWLMRKFAPKIALGRTEPWLGIELLAPLESRGFQLLPR